MARVQDSEVSGLGAAGGGGGWGGGRGDRTLGPKETVEPEPCLWVGLPTTTQPRQGGLPSPCPGLPLEPSPPPLTAGTELLSHVTVPVSPFSSGGGPVLRAVVVPPGDGAVQPARHPAGGVHPGPARPEQEVRELRPRWDGACLSPSPHGGTLELKRLGLPSWIRGAHIHIPFHSMKQAQQTSLRRQRVQGNRSSGPRPPDSVPAPPSNGPLGHLASVSLFPHLHCCSNAGVFC